MINTAEEKIYPLFDFARRLKAERGIERSYSCVFKWVNIGWSPRGRDEPVIKLESVGVSGIAHTSFEAFDRFLAEQAEAKQAAEVAG